MCFSGLKVITSVQHQSVLGFAKDLSAIYSMASFTFSQSGSHDGAVENFAVCEQPQWSGGDKCPAEGHVLDEGALLKNAFLCSYRACTSFHTTEVTLCLIGFVIGSFIF